MDFCSILKLARVDVGNVSKKGENMEGIIILTLLATNFLLQNYPDNKKCLRALWSKYLIHQQTEDNNV